MQNRKADVNQKQNTDNNSLNLHGVYPYMLGRVSRQPSRALYISSYVGSVYQSIRRYVKLPVDSRYAVRLTQAEQHRNRTSPSDNAAGFGVLSNDCSARVLQ